MAEAPEGFRQRLEQESLAWVAGGVISEEQRALILAAVPVQEAPQKRRLTSTIVTLGALFIGFGVILFFASNWQNIGPYPKMGILLAALLGAYGTGRYIESKMPDYPLVAMSFHFLGAILYGANIFLVAQAFNISAHWPNGVLSWALGVLPLALLLGSRAMTVLALLGFSFWIGAEHYLALGRRHDEMVLFLPMFMLWGAALMSAGSFAEKKPSFARIAPMFSILGLICVLAAAFFFTFREHGYGGNTHTVLSKVADSRRLFFAYCGAFSTAALILSLVRLVEQGRGLVLWALGAAVWAWVSAAFLPLGAVPTALAGNIVYFIGIILLLYIGYLRTQSYCVNLGLIAFAALLIARYFDFAWRYMERSAGFMVGGLLLLLMGFSLERGRRKLLEGRK
ncbi:MAG: DUF2157 domain-containing protein [Elusimicrobiota bacterium]|jgi:uncharacterized membrane protein